MKAGPHSGFDLEQIFDMKKREEKLHDVFFWGYSGTLCHPHSVLEFVQHSTSRHSEPPVLVLEETKSKYVSSIGRIKKYSLNGRSYYPLPKGIYLTGCTYAVIGKGLEKVHFALDLNRYKLVNGKRKGEPLGGYIRYHVNKGCATLFSTAADTPKRFVQISYVANLVTPYCVFLR